MALLNTWQPRNYEHGSRVHISEEAEDYESNSPEQKLVEYLGYWKKHNYGAMANCLPASTEYSAKALPGRVRETYKSKNLYSFEIIEIDDEAAAITTIKVRLQIEEKGKSEHRLEIFRLINEDSESNPVMRGKLDSSWVLYANY